MSSSCIFGSRRLSVCSPLVISSTFPRWPLARFKNEMLSGLKRCFAMSIALRITSSGKLLLLTRRSLAPVGTSIFLGIRPFSVRGIVKNGFGFLSTIGSISQSSFDFMSHIRMPLSLVSPWFCWTVEPAYHTRPSSSKNWRLWISPSIEKSWSSKIVIVSSPLTIVQPTSVLQLLIEPW